MHEERSPSDEAPSRETPRGRKTWLHTARAAALIGTLGTGALGYATDGKGCVVAPVHGSSVRFVGNGTVPIRFAGEANDTSTVVRIERHTLNKSPGSISSTTGHVTISNISLTPDPTDGKRRFDVTLNIPRTELSGGTSVNFWPEDDLTYFMIREQLGNGTSQIMNIVNAGGTVHNQPTIGVADQPDDANFGNLAARPDQTSVSGQVANTFLTKKGIGTNANAVDYYNAVGAPSNLTTFKNNNSFPSGEFVTYYRNEQDLGFGREMHCKVVVAGAFATSQRAACYVTNYANENDAAAGTGVIATVAMDYDAARSDKVRFYVFDASGNRVNSAALDGGGAKFVPQLCTQCHGGSYNTTTKKVDGAHFLPFDVANLPVPSAKGAQDLAFKSQNAVVWSIEVGNGGAAITELVAGWYLKSDGSSGLFDTTTSYNGKFAPSGWAGSEGAYVTMVAPYCRSCHIAQSSFLNWNTKDQFKSFIGTINDRVCNKLGPVMPHAQRTYQKFWQSGARAVLGVDMGEVNCSYKKTFQ